MFVRVKKYDSAAEEHFIIPENANIEHKGLKTHRDSAFFRKLLS